MNYIQFSTTIASWINSSGTTIGWTNNASTVIDWLSAGNSYDIRMADFVRVTTPSGVYRFATTPTALTIVLDSEPNTFDALGSLVKIGDVTRDIKSTANETTATLVGIDTALLGWVLGQEIKGAKIEMWHGFFYSDGTLITSGGTNGLYKYFTGYINSFSISEQWMEEIRSYVGYITISASSIQLILQNRTAGRYTNNNSWTYWNPSDTAMNRIGYVQTINYQFGKDAPPNS